MQEFKTLKVIVKDVKKGQMQRLKKMVPSIEHRGNLQGASKNCTFIIKIIFE